MNVAVAGLGFMGATHARAWTRIPGARLYAVISGDERKWTGDLRGAGGNLGGAGVQLDLSGTAKFRTLDEALADAAIDAVDICLPTNQHADAALRCLRNGRDVLVEKPMALRGADADALANEAERDGRILMCAQVCRFMPAYREARRWMHELGPARSARFERRCAAPQWSAWLNDPKQSGGGAFDLLIHDVDAAIFLLGEPDVEDARGMVDAERGIDLMTGALRCGGVPVTVNGGWYGNNAYPFSMSFTIVCDGGTIEYDRELGLYRTEAPPETVALTDEDPFEAELAHFAQCVESGKVSPICPPRESARAVHAMQDLVKARSENSARQP